MELFLWMFAISWPFTICMIFTTLLIGVAYILSLMDVKIAKRFIRWLSA